MSKIGTAVEILASQTRRAMFPFMLRSSGFSSVATVANKYGIHFFTLNMVSVTAE